MDKRAQIDALFTEMMAAALPLQDQSPFVPGDGDPNAKIVFIGEAAGFHEAQQRKPFVGRSGKLLTVVMEENGMRRETVWITNVVKARPPENRDPLPMEIEAYRPYLDRELSIIRPAVIVTLGRFALNWFLPEVMISRVHGTKQMASGGQVIFPMFHPSAALRAPDMMRSFREDFVKLVEVGLGMKSATTISVVSESPVELAQPAAKQKKLFI